MEPSVFTIVVHVGMAPNMRHPRQHGPPHQQYYGPQQHGNYRQQSTNYHSYNKPNSASHYGPNNQNQGPRKVQAANQSTRHGERLSNSAERKSDLDPNCNPFVPLQVCIKEKFRFTSCCKT